MPKPSARERELAHMTHLKEYIQLFLRRWSRPRRRFERMEEALRELEQERLLLIAEVNEGAPSLNKISMKEKED